MEKIIAGTQKVLEVLLAFFAGALTLLCIWQVMARYFFKLPTVAEEELARFGLVWLAFIGTTLAFARGEQLSLTLLHEIFETKSPLTVFIMKICVNVTVLFVMLTVMVIGGWALVRNNMNQLTPVLQMKKGLIYSIVPICGLVAIFFQSVIFVRVLKEGVKK